MCPLKEHTLPTQTPNHFNYALFSKWAKKYAIPFFLYSKLLFLLYSQHFSLCLPCSHYSSRSWFGDYGSFLVITAENETCRAQCLAVFRAFNRLFGEPMWNLKSVGDVEAVFYVALFLQSKALHCKRFAFFWTTQTIPNPNLMLPLHAQRAAS